MEPRTKKEALIAELLGDLDGLLKRVEQLPARVEALESRMASTAAILDAAGERFRGTILSFTEQAKERVYSYVEQRAREASARLLESQRAEVHQAVLEVLAVEAAKADRHARSYWARIVALVCLAALVAGSAGGAVVYWLVR